LLTGLVRASKRHACAFSGLFPALAILAALWVISWNVLRQEWSANPQYAYGWAIPFVAVALAYLRWETYSLSLEKTPESGSRRASLWLLVAGIALLALQAPIRWIQVASPEWRTLLWVQAMQIAGLTALALCRIGGKHTLRYFLFPIIFGILAVPWPSNPERWLVARLTQLVTSVTTECLNLSGVPALQRGNVIEINTGIVGVAEACSGIRSLQTSLMLALLLGELARFRWSQRFVLIAGGLLAALGANIGRTYFLVMIAAAHGLDSLHRWHDIAGLGEFVGSAAALVGLTWLLKRWSPAAQSIASAVETSAKNAADMGNTPTKDALKPRPLFPRALLVGFAIWIVLVEAGVELWYRAHERGLPPAVEWTVNLPAPVMHAFQRVPVPDETQSILRANEGQSATWQDAEGRAWRLFYFRWLPGHASTRNAEVHRPEICLPALDLHKTDDYGVITVDVTGLPMPLRFDHTGFESARGQKLDLFYALISDRPSPETTPFSTDRSARSRLEAARQGRRNQGQRMIELAVVGSETSTQLNENIVQVLRSILHRQ
jgi:exosortase